MINFDGVPAIVAQMGESIMSETTPTFVKQNQLQSLRNIQKFCEAVIASSTTAMSHKHQPRGRRDK
jgi:hypothetical protein